MSQFVVEEAAAGPGPESAAPPAAPKVVRLCDGIIRWSIYVMAAVLPLFFLPWTIEVVELNKQLLLLIGASVTGIAWLGKMLAERKFEYRRSVVNLMVVLFLAVYALSAWSSSSGYMSVMGDFGQEKAGLITVVSFVVLYFVIANNVRTMRTLHCVIKSIMIGGFVAAVYALLQGFGVHILPFAFSKTPSFNTVGTAAALGVYLAFITTMAGGLLLAGHAGPAEGGKKKRICRIAYNVMLVLTAVISLFLIAALDFWPLTLSLLVSAALLIGFAFVHAKSVKGISGVLLPIAAVIIAVLLLIFRFPVNLGFPAEVMPSMKATADITMKTLREAPLLGSGPGTFLFDYAKFRAPEVNMTAFWNVRFDRGASRFLTLLATIGLFGALSWLMMSLFLLVSSGRKLFKSDEKTWHILIGIFSAWFLLVFSKFLYSSTLTLELMFWVTMALLVVVHRKDFYSVKFENSPRAAMILSFVFILTIVFVLSGLFVEGQRYAAETAYAKAIRIDRAGGQADEVIDNLIRAANWNPRNDVYVRNLALALLLKADMEFSTPVTLERGEEESDEDYNARLQAAQQDKLRQATNLTASAVNTANRATEISDGNVANWSVLASIYQGLMGITQGADEWAVRSYEKAIELEPANPTLHTELGKVYIYQSDVAAQQMQTEDEEAKTAAEERRNELLNKAVDAFNKAIELKSDFAPAHFNLALAFDRQGKLKEAIAKMEAVVGLEPRDVGVGFQLSLLYFRDDQKENAIGLMEAVVQLSPNFSNARWYLAAMYEDAGRLDEAIVQIEKVKELNPNNDLVVRKLDELKKRKEAPPPPEEGLPPPVEQPVQNPNEPGVQP